MWGGVRRMESVSEHTFTYVCLLVSEFTSSTFELCVNNAVFVCGAGGCL